MIKLYESLIKRRGMLGIPLYRIKRGVAKLLEKFIKDNTYGFAIRGHCVNRSFGFQTTGMQSIPEHRIKRGVAL